MYLDVIYIFRFIILARFTHDYDAWGWTRLGKCLHCTLRANLWSDHLILGSCASSLDQQLHVTMSEGLSARSWWFEPQHITAPINRLTSISANSEGRLPSSGSAYQGSLDESHFCQKCSENYGELTQISHVHPKHWWPRQTKSLAERKRRERPLGRAPFKFNQVEDPLGMNDTYLLVWKTRYEDYWQPLLTFQENGPLHDDSPGGTGRCRREVEWECSLYTWQRFEHWFYMEGPGPAVSTPKKAFGGWLKRSI